MPFDGALAAQVGRETGNYVVSPASVALGLAMAREGARGETAAAFDRVLGAGARLVAKRLLRGVAAMRSGGTELAIANRLFGDRALAVLPEFLDITARDYGAPIELLDFCGASDASRVQINAWVARVTRDKISDLLPEGSIETLTRLVLVDAVYLKAAWEMPFDEALTGPAAFAIDGAGSRRVPTMHVVADVRLGQHAGARMLELPYRAALGMLVVVPDGASLASVEAVYARGGLAPFRAALRKPGSTAIAMPKFQARTSIDLRRALVELGLGDAFGATADFTGIATTTPPLAISGVTHQAWIAVAEAGTEAAAATAIEGDLAEAAVALDPPRFDVDRSFLFFVHDAADNVLFGGRIIDPTA